MQRREDGVGASGISCHSSQSFTFNLGRFETKKGDKVCANPEDKWVKRAVRELLKKKKLHAP